VKHALGVQRALAVGNYCSFFELYFSAPNMGGYIMDHFIDRERTRALIIISKACVPEDSIVFLLIILVIQLQDDTHLVRPQGTRF